MPLPAASPERAPLRQMVPLADYTTLKIGGPAEFFYEPQRPEDLAAVLTRLEREEMPVRLLGGGANTLAPDGGVPGAVIHTGTLRRIFREGDCLRAWPGVTLPQLVRTALLAGLSGLDRLVGVPGQVGGGLAMNAGSASWGLWDEVEEVSVWEPGGVVRRLLPSDIGPGYRDGRLRGRVILEALFRLRPEAPAALKARQDEYLRAKNATQPVTLSSAGCAFKNPPGDSAGRLVDAAGLKGARLGGAEISSVHANFIVNRGAAAGCGASAADVRGLVERAEREVFRQFGIRLERELVIWPEPVFPLSLRSESRREPGILPDPRLP
jgi:UDP-N-acetylmuramate dehydrogenase